MGWLFHTHIACVLASLCAVALTAYGTRKVMRVSTARQKVLYERGMALQRTLRGMKLSALLAELRSADEEITQLTARLVPIHETLRVALGHLLRIAELRLTDDEMEQEETPDEV